MNVLLVNPRFPIAFYSLGELSSALGHKTTNPPLGLLTVAALLPRHWNLRLTDENVREASQEDFAFAQKLGMPQVMLNILIALPGTALWQRLTEVDRLTTFRHPGLPVRAVHPRRPEPGLPTHHAHTANAGRPGTGAHPHNSHRIAAGQAERADTRGVQAHDGLSLAAWRRVHLPDAVLAPVPHGRPEAPEQVPVLHRLVHQVRNLRRVREALPCSGCCAGPCARHGMRATKLRVVVTLTSQLSSRSQ